VLPILYCFTGSGDSRAPITALDISCNCLTKGSWLLKRRGSTHDKNEHTVDYRGVAALASAICKCTDIVQVIFSGCTTQSTQSTQSSGSLVTHADVITIDIESDSTGPFNGKKLGMSGAMLLTSVLPRWGKLLELDLSDNGLQRQGALFLIKHGFPRDSPWSTRLGALDLSANSLVSVAFPFLPNFMPCFRVCYGASGS
jgi:hypothetical protein